MDIRGDSTSDSSIPATWSQSGPWSQGNSWWNSHFINRVFHLLSVSFFFASHLTCHLFSLTLLFNCSLYLTLHLSLIVTFCWKSSYGASLLLIFKGLIWKKKEHKDVVVIDWGSCKFIQFYIFSEFYSACFAFLFKRNIKKMESCAYSLAPSNGCLTTKLPGNHCLATIAYGNELCMCEFHCENSVFSFLFLPLFLKRMCNYWGTKSEHSFSLHLFLGCKKKKF